MNATKTVTLLDFANDTDYPVLFYTAVGTPMGAYSPLGSDVDFAERRGLLDLEGTVDGDGDWNWDGEGSPRDDRQNSFTKLQAYNDKAHWERLVAEYESGE